MPETNPPSQPDALQCALLLLALWQSKETQAKREITRLRIAELTLKRLWGRRRIHPGFLEDVQNWLHRAGWVLFDAGKTFAFIRMDVVESWPRVTSKIMTEDLSLVSRGTFDYDRLYPLVQGDAVDED
jgi:hypothetical protein